ncbi:MAG: hypothetical protein QME58_14480, partial [Bacteroidota bacterium]|nr:hypothetical protein [Bacteroidota bacterium]
MKIKSEVLNSNHETNTNFLNLKSKIYNLKSPIFLLLFAILYLLFFYSCRERVVPPDVPPYIPPIVLTAEDIGVTDAFIRVRFVDTTISRAFKLTREGQTILTAPSSPLDTLILDEGLLPKRTYKYKAYRLLNSTPIDSSAELIVLSMDTTSHEYFFQIDTL